MTKLLIVEDEPALREVYVTIFKLEKYDVHQAANGQDALQQLKKLKPDIILLDVLMPEMGGLEFLRQADLAKQYPDTKVLMLSNLSDAKTLRQITELGASKYVLKASVTPMELVQAVKSL